MYGVWNNCKPYKIWPLTLNKYTLNTGGAAKINNSFQKISLQRHAGGAQKNPSLWKENDWLPLRIFSTTSKSMFTDTAQFDWASVILQKFQFSLYGRRLALVTASRKTLIKDGCQIWQIFLCWKNKEFFHLLPNSAQFFLVSNTITVKFREVGGCTERKSFSTVHTVAKFVIC